MKLLLAAAAAVAFSGSAALAWGDMYMGDPTNNPNSNFLMHAYNAPNFCPAGLSPVLINGVVCCGQPNAGAYINRPGKVYRQPVYHKPAPRAYAPEGEKGVVYR
ncbi:hypothetical protein [Sagittula salina]|uniref:Uncharacterized protein n=1 Tax=Sagittula salina TaxID=2820268 RepID=A0A940S1Z4_9RHOB|nr:hypothetical protein [Sagittula salina]MBP0483591.1 hypothetical protein [Sagittula salina]